MGKNKGKTTTQTTGLDPRSQMYVDRLRAAAQNAGNVATGHAGSYFAGPLTGQNIADAMNPYTQGVIGSLGDRYDRLRGQASVGVDQAATQAGAFGGSRHGIAQGQRMAELDQAEMGHVAGLLNSQYGNAVNLAEMQRQQRQMQLQEPLFRQQNALQFMNLGMGPTGQVSTLTQPGPSFLGQLAGAGLTLAGLPGGSLFGKLFD